MATVAMLKHPQSGLHKKGFVGFSWTMFFWGALFRSFGVTLLCHY
jgi:hypothetical protein